MRWNLDVFRRRITRGWSERTETVYRFNLGNKVGIGSIPEFCGAQLEAVDRLTRCFPVSCLMREHCRGPGGGELVLSVGDFNDSGADDYIKRHFKTLVNYVMDDIDAGYTKLENIESGITHPAHVTRSLDIARAIDHAARSVDVVVATEDPVMASRNGVLIPEVILVSGMRFARPELPLLRDHVKSSQSVIGTVKDLRIDTGARVVRGRAFFSPTGEHEWENAVNGHGLDVSVGASILDQRVLVGGESAVIEGRTYNGPIVVVTACTMYELSIVTLGADARAKMLV